MTWTAPWHAGLTLQTELLSVTANFLAVDVRYVADRVIRAFTDGEEDDHIANLIRTATEIAEDHSHRAIRPSVRRLLMTGFPSSYVELPYPPVIEVQSVEYYDGDNQLQDYGGSPPSWILSGFRLEPGVGLSWPSTTARAGAVVITYRAGYETKSQVPWKVKQGIAVLAGELYKNPDLSNADGQVANLINLDHFFPRHY